MAIHRVAAVEQARCSENIQILPHYVCSCDGFCCKTHLIFGRRVSIYASGTNKYRWSRKPMSEITHGVRSILSHSSVYNLFQWIMGATRGRIILSAQYVKAKDGDSVLDIGCGTAEFRLFLPNVEYFGFDPNVHYIEAAKKRLQAAKKTGTLLHASLEVASLTKLPKFDIVLASGVLHHLNDDEVIQLARLAGAALKESGKLIAIEPCFVEGQSLIARYFVSHDRGQHVRDVKGYQTLLSSVFASVACDVRHDIARVPYSHLIMECKL